MLVPDNVAFVGISAIYSSGRSVGAHQEQQGTDGADRGDQEAVVKVHVDYAPCREKPAEVEVEYVQNVQQVLMHI